MNDAKGIIFTLLNLRKLSYSYPCAPSSKKGIKDKNSQKSDANPCRKNYCQIFEDFCPLSPSPRGGWVGALSHARYRAQCSNEGSEDGDDDFNHPFPCKSFHFLMFEV